MALRLASCRRVRYTKAAISPEPLADTPQFRGHPVKIVFLSPAAQGGGAESVLLEWIGTIRQSCPDWPLHVISGEDGPLLRKAEELGATCETLMFPKAVQSFGESRSNGPPQAASAAKPKFFQRITRLFRWGLAGVATLRYAWKLHRRLTALAPAVIHTNGMKMHLLGALVRPKQGALIWHLHDYLGSRAAMKPLLRRLSSRCALVVANSHSVADDVRAVLSNGPPVETVYNTVDITVFNPEGPRLDLDDLSGMPPAPPGIVKIGLVATFALWKGHEVFLRAAAATFGSTRFYVVGGPVYATAGSQRTVEELRALAGLLGIGDRVGFTGFVDDAAAAMRALDIVVHASTEPEPFGLVIVQALGCARAAVVSAGGGADELVKPGMTALTHPPGDVEALREALDRLATDRSLRIRLGKAGRTDVEKRFGRQRLAGEVGPLFERITSFSR